MISVLNQHLQTFAVFFGMLILIGFFFSGEDIILIRIKQIHTVIPLPSLIKFVHQSIEDLFNRSNINRFIIGNT